MRCWVFERVIGSPARHSPIAIDHPEFRTKLRAMPLWLTPHLIGSLDHAAQRFLDAHGLGGEPLTWQPDEHLFGECGLTRTPPAVNTAAVQQALRSGTRGLSDIADEYAVSIDYLRYTWKCRWRRMVPRTAPPGMSASWRRCALDSPVRRSSTCMSRTGTDSPPSPSSTGFRGNHSPGSRTNMTWPCVRRRDPAGHRMSSLLWTCRPSPAMPRMSDQTGSESILFASRVATAHTSGDAGGGVPLGTRRLSTGRDDDPRFGPLLFGGGVTGNLGEQVPIDVLGAGAYRALTGPAE